MSAVLDALVKKCESHPKRIALCECESEKTLLAARYVVDHGMGVPVLVNDPAVIKATAEKAGVSLDGMEIFDTSDEAAMDALLDEFYPVISTIIDPNFLRPQKVYKRKYGNPLGYAMMLETLGRVDCSFQGHLNTTADVYRAARSCIGMQDGVSCVSIAAIVETPGFEGPEGDTIVFTDCGLNTDPDEEGLASIAIAAANTIHNIMGWEPRVAFLSYSTDDSGAGPSVERVKGAVAKAREIRPDLKFDGPFQLDAAIDPVVAKNKLNRESDVAGKANILVFPDLNAANIAVKLIQRFAKGQGLGHTMYGFRKPVADSSRSASVEEILGDIALVILACGD